ncbi:hypothetical protein [Roseisalinus antarcticus]|uniref:Ferrochelatase n=1 Tax=Roseisalinus antarcticus TaxID=254357 RepID=A0A1Y5S5W9_9RHOB|nr:hypothetical protein [Roseisalinus antarcticus]SLN32759.1 hypothetical protein ROA7023_01141 [Roseisalinus antarcticus]
MKRLILAACIVATTATAGLADGPDTAAPAPTESIERQTMGGSFPTSTLVTLVVIGIIAAAIDTSN